MLIIGERINSTRANIQKAIRLRNAAALAKEAKGQFARGARILDINCAMGLDNEPDDLDWAISVVQSELPLAGVCVDSPSCLAITRALSVYKGGGDVFINSITAEAARIEEILPLALKYNAKLIALTMDENGMPASRLERRDIAARILDAVKKKGFDPSRLYFDPLVRPISTEPQQAAEFLGSIPLIKELGGVKTICGLSNISFGLPKRSLVNSAFLTLAASCGLDAAILDPLDKDVSSSIFATEAVLGRDAYCKDYLAAFRKGLL